MRSALAVMVAFAVWTMVLSLPVAFRVRLRAAELPTVKAPLIAMLPAVCSSKSPLALGVVIAATVMPPVLLLSPIAILWADTLLNSPCSTPKVRVAPDRLSNPPTAIWVAGVVGLISTPPDAALIPKLLLLISRVSALRWMLPLTASSLLLTPVNAMARCPASALLAMVPVRVMSPVVALTTFSSIRLRMLLSLLPVTVTPLFPVTSP